MARRFLLGQSWRSFALGWTVMKLDITVLGVKRGWWPGLDMRKTQADDLRCNSGDVEHAVEDKK
jgi:hypothetical protein